MAIKQDFVSTRFDESTKEILLSLANDLDFTQSEIIRRAVRVFGELIELKKRSNFEFLARTKDGKEKTFILLG